MSPFATPVPKEKKGCLEQDHTIHGLKVPEAFLVRTGMLHWDHVIRTLFLKVWSVGHLHPYP